MARADDGRDAERDKAELYLENITDCVCEIISSYADKDDEAVTEEEDTAVVETALAGELYIWG